VASVPVAVCCGCRRDFAKAVDVIRAEANWLLAIGLPAPCVMWIVVKRLRAGGPFCGVRGGLAS